MFSGSVVRTKITNNDGTFPIISDTLARDAFAAYLNIQGSTQFEIFCYNPILKKFQYRVPSTFKKVRGNCAFAIATLDITLPNEVENLIDIPISLTSRVLALTMGNISGVSVAGILGSRTNQIKIGYVREGADKPIPNPEGLSLRENHLLDFVPLRAIKEYTPDLDTKFNMPFLANKDEIVKDPAVFQWDAQDGSLVVCNNVCVH